MSSVFEIVAIKFRDIPDVINRLKRSRTFQTRWFKIGDKQDEESALKELWASARKHGLTVKEIFKVRRRAIEVTNNTPMPSSLNTKHET